jgi:hypothetical protein
MTRVTVDPALGEKLSAASGLLTICDVSGNTLGYFQRVLPPGSLKQMSPFTDDDIERLRTQSEGRPLSQIWDDLQPREP